VVDEPSAVLGDRGRNDYRARHAQLRPVLVRASAVRASDQWAAEGPEKGTEGTEEGPADFRFAVRPYTWTRGRTRPVSDLALETLVSTSERGRDTSAICSAEYAAIAQLCSDVRSVAEVAALLTLPLGVVRVLLADMIDNGLVHVHPSFMGWGSAPGRSMMERVLVGLKQL